MGILANIPLMIVPFIAYNLVIMGFVGAGNGDPWAVTVLSLPMLSGVEWRMDLGDLLIIFSLLLLFFEILKATRINANTIVDHLLSTFVFIAFLVEFLLVRSAAHSVFFILMAITFVDVIAGFSVSIRSATRDVTLGDRY
jgi:hypothetical protein